MTYEEAREFIDSSARFGIKLGLETITELLKRIDNPQEQLKVIHVAGTNGKGSTTAYIAAILAQEGYKVGRYISPAVFSSREMIQISPRSGDEVITDLITEEGIGEAISAIKAACEEMVKEGFDHPTFYELETAMAFYYLNKEHVDFAVIEVMMGGRLDATNAISHPLCSVITSISMDHMQYLGDTLSKIAKEKAGIIKRGAPVITSNTVPEVLEVLKNTCTEKETSLTIASRDAVSDITYSPEGTSFTYMGFKITICLLGDYQITNAILALRTAQVLSESGYNISQSSIIDGLRHTRWSGRFEVLRKEPYFIIDGAHNEDAALQLKRALQTYFSGRKLIFIMGVLADKDFNRILEIMAPLAHLIITITPPNKRALASERLAAEAKKFFSGTVIDAVTVSNAVEVAYEQAGKDDVIIAFGSLSFLGEIAGLLGTSSRIE